ncbi:MAG: ATP-binding cassette domain-containing protein [Elusimicrobia bacterium]|nr:ATP-binding cassette domain-containing protein [Elusimicrobiota bacterium]
MHKPLALKNLSLVLPHKICFENFNASVPYGAKIAVIGVNGGGKTTLLRAIKEDKTLIDGEIAVPPGAVVSYVPQTVTEHDDLSGGQRFNKALSSALAAAPDILLLDEPTNHLDRANRKSLMNMLEYFKGTLIVVSHDPELLRNVGTIWNIENGAVNIFTGNYDDYMRESEIKRAGLNAKLESLEKEKKQNHRSLMAEQERAAKSRRHGELARDKGKWAPIIAGGMERRAEKTAGSKKSAIFDKKDEINEQIRALGVREIIKPSFNIPAGAQNGTALFIMDGAAGYGGKVVISGVNLTVAAGEKVAVTGDNASGKSTLFKAIMNPARRLGGTWDAPKTEEVGFLDQHYNNIAGTRNALDVISAAAPQWTHAEIRKHLNDFLFRKNEEVNLDISLLSGGERARLSLAAIAARVPRLLLLDEITNNIDLATRRHIEEILSAYPGAMIVISHEDDFINSVGVQTVYSFQNGTLKKGV